MQMSVVLASSHRPSATVVRALRDDMHCRSARTRNLPTGIPERRVLWTGTSYVPDGRTELGDLILTVVRSQAYAQSSLVSG